MQTIEEYDDNQRYNEELEVIMFNMPYTQWHSEYLELGGTLDFEQYLERMGEILRKNNL